MGDEWAGILESAGVNGGGGVRDADAKVVIDRTDCAQLSDLTVLSVLDVCGEDAKTFLQGQLINDILKVSATRAQITGYCTPKGRLLALPIIVGIDNGFRLVLPQDIKDAFVKRLSMFIMRAKVTIAERVDCACSGVIASEDGDLVSLGSLLGALPAAAMDVASSAQGQVIRWHDMPGSVPRARYLLIGTKESQVSVWSAGRELPMANDALWRLGDIRAGLPSITSGVLEAFVPQMLNLQLIAGLSFTKGCYPGQEIVARMQYLGKLKRHMRRFTMPLEDAQSAPAAGSMLATDGDADAGIVVDSVVNPAGDAEVLAVVKVSTTNATLNIAGQVMTAGELPYELPSLADAQLSAS